MTDEEIQIEVFGYYEKNITPDSVKAELMKHARRFAQAGRWSDFKKVKEIAENINSGVQENIIRPILDRKSNLN